MKKTTLMLTGALAATSLTSSAALIAGWDTWVDSGSDLYNATSTNNSTASMQGTVTNGAGGIGNFNNSGALFGASDDGSWGTLTTSAPSTSVADQTAAVGLVNTANGTFDFTVTAATGTIIDFTSFNFDSYRRFANSASSMQLSVLSGALTLGDVGSALTIVRTTTGSDPMSNADPNDFDIDLSGLADRRLEGGESAVFRMTFTGGNGSGGGGNNTMVDNVGIFGDVVPEPSTALLSMLGGIFLLRRRR